MPPPSPGLGAVSQRRDLRLSRALITKTPELYQEATRRIVMGGANTRSESYVQGRRQVELGRREIANVFASIDLLVTPTTTSVTSLIPQRGASAAAPAAAAGPAPAGGRAPGFRNTSYFSFYGLPAISVPCGVASSGLPIGLQISGNHFAEATVLALAHAYEQATEWHKRRPSLST
ncbi:MAG TPA: amidase family protein [Candidatus Binatia bacterium]|jgi:aspartyl-tRNA(Asn)/glutamyl-tRNA(Gln) amidotransferase subunit A